MPISKAEVSVSRQRRAILDRAAVGQTIESFGEFQHFLSGLEYFLPGILAEIHLEWKHESFDGFLAYVARKTGEQEAELIGHCILISDQTTTPIHLRLQLAPNADEVSWLELKLGERGRDGMVRRPQTRPPSMRGIAELKDGTDTIDWVYRVTFGERRQ